MFVRNGPERHCSVHRLALCSSLPSLPVQLVQHSKSVVLHESRLVRHCLPELGVTGLLIKQKKKVLDVGCILHYSRYEDVNLPSFGEKNGQVFPHTVFFIQPDHAMHFTLEATFTQCLIGNKHIHTFGFTWTLASRLKTLNMCTGRFELDLSSALV